METAGGKAIALRGAALTFVADAFEAGIDTTSQVHLVVHTHTYTYMWRGGGPGRSGGQGPAGVSAGLLFTVSGSA